MLTIWLKAQPMKSMNWNSATGRKPVSDAPKAASTMADLGDRRVDHALRPEVVDEAFGHLERAAVDADVLADAEDAGSRSISSQIPWRMASR